MNTSQCTDSVLYFPQSVNFASVSAATSLGASVVWDTGLLSMSTGPAAGSSCTLAGVVPIYLNQQDKVSIKLNVAFAAPAEGLLQTIGVGDTEAGVFVGYNGLDFGILLRLGGSRQYWTVQCTAPCTADGNIVITLLGVQHSVPVTAGMNIIHVLWAIAMSTAIQDANINSSVGYDKVSLYTQDTGDFTGLGTAIDFGGTGITGSITLAVEGVAVQETWILQEDFNAQGRYAVADLSLTDMNVFEFLCSRWSVGAIAFKMLNTHNDDITLVHEWMPSGLGFNTSIPYQPTICLQNQSCTDQHTMRSSMACISSGTPTTCSNRSNFSYLFSARKITVLPNTSTVVAAFSVPVVMNGARNRMSACVSSIKIVADTPRPVRVQAIVNGIISDAVLMQQHVPWSCVKRAAVNGTVSVEDGVQMGSIYVKDRAEERVITFDQLWCVPGTRLTISVTAAQDPVTMSIDCEVVWVEV